MFLSTLESSTNDSTDAVVALQPTGLPAASAASIVLTDGSPGSASLIPTTLGGAAIPNNARWAGQWTPLSPDTNGGPFDNLRNLGRAPIHGPLVVDNTADGRIQLFLFASGKKGDVWTDWQTTPGANTWSGWTDFGGSGLKVDPENP